jgi:hypothetical protein
VIAVWALLHQGEGRPRHAHVPFGELDRIDARVGGADRAGEQVAQGGVVGIDQLGGQGVVS